MKQQRHVFVALSSKSGYYVISNGLYMVRTAALEKAVQGGVDGTRRTEYEVYDLRV